MEIRAFSATFKQGPTVSGSAGFPLHCTTPESCVAHFDLHTPELTLADLNRLMNPASQSRPWYHLLTLGQRDDNALTKLRGQGRVSIARLTLGALPLTNVSTSLELKAGAVSARELKADAFGGHHIGNWDADFTASPPKFYGSGSVTKIAMAQISVAMHDPWATGVLGGQYTVGLAGLDKAQLLDSAAGSGDFKWTDGTVRHVILEAKAAPLSFGSFKGEIALHSKTVSCQGCFLQTPDAEYNVVGTAGLDRSLDLKLEQSGSTAYTISGPLEKPTVEAVTAPQVEAKQR